MNPLSETIEGQIGAHERQLRRKARYPALFGVEEIAPQAWVEAAARDRREVAEFVEEFDRLFDDIANLPDSIETEAMLELKARLDRSYTTAVGLAGDQSQRLVALQRMTEVMMKMFWQIAGQDPMAIAELEQEEMARRQHYTLLEQVLVSDLLRPESAITEEEIVPTLLCSDESALDAALWLFSPYQLQQLQLAGTDLLATVGAPVRGRHPELERNLETICEQCELCECG